jgi:LDH2 family malate/lactate/ureidoglycolate dehydrogenase
MIDALRKTPTAEGQDRIQIHGEPEFRAARFNRVHGVPLLQTTVEMIRGIAHSLQLQPDF